MQVASADSGADIEFQIGQIAERLDGFVVVEELEEVDKKRRRSVWMREVRHFSHGGAAPEQLRGTLSLVKWRRKFPRCS
jgi:hypothetical protein